MTDIHDLRTLKDRQDVLLAELQHRTRNLLGVVQAVARQTMNKSGSLDAFRESFEERLRALSRVQSMLAELDFGDVSLRALIEAELVAHGDGATHTRKIVVEGPDVALAPTSAQALALAIHELATNAVKYGALAQAAGRMTVTWDVTRQERGDVATIVWKESDVAMPRPAGDRKGYGTELITRALPYQLGATTGLIYETDGVRCTIVLPVKEVRHAE